MSKQTSLTKESKELSWTGPIHHANVEAGVSQGYILGTLFFLIYVNDLSNGLTSNPKLSVDDISLLFIVHDVKLAVNNLNNRDKWMGLSFKTRSGGY